MKPAEPEKPLEAPARWVSMGRDQLRLCDYCLVEAGLAKSFVVLAVFVRLPAKLANKSGVQALLTHFCDGEVVTWGVSVDLEKDPEALLAYLDRVDIDKVPRDGVKELRAVELAVLKSSYFALYSLLN